MLLFVAGWTLLCAALTACGRAGGSSAGNRQSQPLEQPVYAHVTAESGIDFALSSQDRILTILESVGHGVAMLDADGDGLQDLVFAGRDRMALYRNLGEMRFQDITQQSGLRQKGTWGGIAVGDFDNDGRPDLYFCGYDCSALYRNLGEGRFEEVRESGLDVKPAPAGGCPEWRTSAGWIDYDADGRLDLFVCRYAQFGPNTVQLCSDPTKPEKYACSPDIYRPQMPALFHNEGGGKFTDVSTTSGVTDSGGRNLGVAFADYNADGRVDIAVANDERPGDLFTNLGRGRFRNDGPRSGTAFSALGRVHGGMGIDWADFDGDRRFDLFVTTYENEAKNLYHNLGNGLFTDKSLDAGLSEKMDRYVGFGVKFLDYNLDGAQDLMVTSGHVISNTERLYPGTSYPQPVQLFENRDGRFEEITSRMSAPARQPLVGRGLAVGDLDNDGRPDVVVSNLEGKPAILHNQSAAAHEWLGLQLVGTRSNRDGFGARVTVQAGEKQRLHFTTNAGSYMTSSDPRLLVGLGAAAAASVEILWPSGARQTIRNLAAGRRYRIMEGSSEVASLSAR